MGKLAFMQETAVSYVTAILNSAAFSSNFVISNMRLTVIAFII